MTTDALARLRDLLEELFQFENAELDFGIYRIMNHKRREVRRFLEEGLPRIVDEALAGGAVARQTGRAEELRRTSEQVKETFGEYAVDSKGGLNENFRETPLGKEYLGLRAAAGGVEDLEELKATIFNHVYTFFNRYYDNGDFLSKKRYSRRQKYAVPYNGEEVHLHWANADQYYVKTGEHFSDYRYKAKNGATVHFDLTAADAEQNNVKGEKRFFVPLVKAASHDTRARELTVPFEYRPLTAKEKTAHGAGKAQEKLLEEAAAALTARFAKDHEALAALEPAGDLARHLRRYARRNTSDFFVHKDLKGFLEGELDFYLKNEVLDVDDIEGWGPDRSESWFEVMRAVKRVGRGVIAFLAQIEDFQKTLFEKKKFVTGAGYCLTLDRVPEELYERVAACEPQREEWVRLFAIDGIEENITQPGYTEPLTVEFLEANPFLVLDTKHFGEDFTDRLLASVEDLDEQTGGLLVESENFQALGLLQERYREQVKCIYIDPPYNSPGNEILYKNDYKHSSWLSLIENRLREASKLQFEDSVLVVAVDENEQERLGLLLQRLHADRELTCVTVVSNPSGQQGDNFSYSHDYAYFSYPKGGRRISMEVREETADIRNFRDVTGESSLRSAAKNCFYPILLRDREIVGFGEVCNDEYHPGGINLAREDGLVEVYPVDPEGTERKWRFARQTVEGIAQELQAKYIRARGVWDIQRVKKEFNYKTVWNNSRYSANN